MGVLRLILLCKVSGNTKADKQGFDPALYIIYDCLGQKNPTINFGIVEGEK